MSKPSTSRGGGRDLTTGSLGRSLASLSGPMFLGSLALVSMNAVDTFYIGQLGTGPLAAMGFTFPLTIVAVGIAQSLASGVQSVVSRAVGQEDEEKVRRVTMHGIILGLLMMAVVGGVGLTWMTEFFTLLGARGSTLGYIEDYMTIWFGALFFFVTPLIAGAALMARGDARTPATLLIVGAVLNGVIDPFLIFGLGPFPALGIEGAALSSAIARFLVTVGILGLVWRDEMLRPRFGDLFTGMTKSWVEILRVALPIVLAAMVFPIALGIITRVLASFGDAAVAAGAAGSRIDALAALVINSLGLGLAPIAGQNWGAGLRGRVLDALRLTERVSVVWGLASWAILASFAWLIAPAFVDGADTAEVLHLYLLIMPASYAADGVMMVCRQVLNAVDRASLGTVIGVVRVFVAAASASLGAMYGSIAIVLVAMVVGDLIIVAPAAVYIHRLLETIPIASRPES